MSGKFLFIETGTGTGTVLLRECSQNEFCVFCITEEKYIQEKSKWMAHTFGYRIFSDRCHDAVYSKQLAGNII